MTLEEYLIHKTYYKATYINEKEEREPIQVLGDAYVLEQQNELPDLSYIRYAQGELYFHYKDFEAAIFKWENIKNELRPWARKNMADAYVELGLAKDAEDIYKSIKSDSTTLQMEVLLQLFSLYINQGQIDLADRTLKEAVSLNPDYPNVTEIARAFYEKQEMVQDAVQLAVSEAIRTESITWFQCVVRYVKKGWTTTYPPNFFRDFIKAVYDVEQSSFEQTLISLWESYSEEDCYLEWLNMLGSILLDLELKENSRISSLYKETYFHLLEGQYFIKEISGIVPDLITNWLKISSSSDKIFVASAILAWNEVYPSSLDPSVISDAEYNICQAKSADEVFTHSLRLFKAIARWSGDHELEVSERTKWMVQQLMDEDAHHLMVIGPTGNGKSSFINSILGGNILKPSTSSIVLFKNSDVLDIQEVREESVEKIADISDFQASTASQLQMKLIDFKMPNKFLSENEIAVIDSPSFQGNSKGRNDYFHYLTLADSLLFVLNANVPFTDKECDILLQIQKFMPGLPIHFVLNKIDTIYSEREVNRIIEETESRLSEYFPGAQVYPYSSVYESDEQLSQLSEFIKTAIHSVNREQGRTENLLYLIRHLISELLEKRVKMENEMVEAISWKEDIVGRLSGARHQLQDLKGEKTQQIQTEYQIIVEEIRNEIISTIPSILKGCTDFIKEDSDFRRIHSELNDEMNNRVHDYLYQDVLPKYYGHLKKWISRSQGEFNQCKEYLDEMCEGFNHLYGEAKLKLEFDFRVIDDWSRDADRMTNSVRLEKINILSRNTPTQLLLKGAGKLFGAIQQNKTMLYTKYKNMVENEDYYETSVIIANKFMHQFDLFEKGLERDITMFFKEPLTMMDQLIEQTHEKINNQHNTLQNLRANPQKYQDPLTLFEIRLRQFEWMFDAAKEIQPIY
ncbi:dynamin family protein [Bacillus sp. FJAT-49736]|uniref:dynamin family protein n=1 Tax=Bacillus sp. FJAT-49736 TaxID=2833582 RepID=UPI001BC95398|nr:dynamin family protein [Bacillus sp. FJAT-49736]MBS4174946.1 dynamin family protein [Bacillus sp. FJAT-49736]